MTRVLIAEDDGTSRLILETLLRRWGCEVRTACDGSEAWAVLQEDDPPRLLVLDWMMPGMDGVEICRRLRAGETARRPVYVILLTAMASQEALVEGLDAGADDYVTKPFDQAELRARLRVGERVSELQSCLARRVEELEAAMARVKTLEGMLPICMHCKRVRNDAATWERIESYVARHSEATFSHGLCPECFEKNYPEA